MKSSILTLVSLLQLSGLTAADFVESPSLARPPNTGSAGPFLIPNTLASSYRWQQVYNATDFGALTEAVFITGVSFIRMSGSAPIDVVLPNIEIHFSTTLGSADGLNNVFANNIGIDDTLVHSGPLHFFDTGIGTYSIHLTFAQPFLYDWRAGNLLMDVRNYSPIPPPMSGSYLLGGELTFGDSVSAIGAIGVNSPNGFGGTGGLVTRFTVVPVPEPGTFALLGLGVFGLGLLTWKRRRSAITQCQ